MIYIEHNRVLNRISQLNNILSYSYYQTAYGRWQAIRCNDKCIRSKKFDFEDHAPTTCSLKYAFKVNECWRNLEN
jgi:hypothetical protein